MHVILRLIVLVVQVRIGPQQLLSQADLLNTLRDFANVITSNHRHDLLYNISDVVCALEELFLIVQYDVLVPQSTIVGAIVC